MKRLKIGIDIDGVLANFVGAFSKLAHERFGKPAKLPYEQVDWDWANAGITEKEISKLWAVIRATENFWQTLEPYPVDLLLPVSLQHDVYFITHRVSTAGRSTTEQSARWIQYHYGIKFPQVIPTRFKGDVADALQLDAFIDDKPSNIIEVAKRVPEADVFVLDAGYNRVPELDGFPRVKSVDYFLREVIVDTERSEYLEQSASEPVSPAL